MTGREALLKAFDRLFDRAAKKLAVECSEEEKEDAKRSFEERFSKMLEALAQLDLRELPEEVVQGMEESIDKLSSPDLVALLASVPLAAQAQQLLRQLAYQAAEQRLLEHYISTADDKYGGN
jgi:conjugal transfer/entry exclusion protein